MAKALANQTAAWPGGLREAIIKLRVKMARESSKVKVISVHLFDMITPERTEFFPLLLRAILKALFMKTVYMVLLRNKKSVSSMIVNMDSALKHNKTFNKSPYVDNFK